MSRPVTIWPGSCYDKDIESIRPWPLTGKNKMNALGNLLRIGREPDDELPAMELLARAPLDQLEDAVRALKARRSTAEIRAAMVDRIARAPLTEFEILKEIYLAHCAD